MTRSVPARLGLVCGVAALIALGSPAVAQEGVAMKNILGNMGLVPREKDPIRYRERAPLVIPPKSELRPPAAPESFASANPQWPSDPDVTAKRRQAAEERTPVTWSEARRMSDKEARLSPDELRAGRSERGEPRVGGYYRGDNSREALYLTPDELRATAKRDGVEPDAVEPTRKVLTEPPTGMRKAAMGGVVKRDYQPRVDQQAADANPMNWLVKQFSGDDDE